MNLFDPDIITYSDYYPGGSIMPGREGSSANYRFGFNGAERDDEMKGSGNSLDYGARILDPRLGRWLSLDPLMAKYPYASPYNFALNTPIWAMDPDGRIVQFANKKSERQFNRLYKAADESTKAKLDVLKNSDVVYNINTESSLNGRLGSSQYNFDKGQFDILIDKKSRNKIGSLGDELTHASQFENGELGYIQNNNGQVGTLGYDMEDEAASKRGEIQATESVDAAEGTTTPLEKTTQAFKVADSQGPQAVENYFQTDPSAKQYLQILDPRGKSMGVNISGSGNYTKEQLQGAVNSGQFKDFIYREKQSDGTNKTVQGSGG